MALNKCIFLGRIANDLEIKQTPSGVSVLTFSIAVDRNFKNANGEYETDFIKCVAFRSVSEFIGRYFYKGRMIAIEGHLQNRSYQDKNGEKRYITEIIVDSANFTGEKSDSGNASALIAEVFLTEMKPAADVLKSIREACKELPIYKQISQVKIRDTEFEKTTSRKIKRFVNDKIKKEDTDEK